VPIEEEERNILFSEVVYVYENVADKRKNMWSLRSKNETIFFQTYKNNVSFFSKCNLAKPIKHNLITATVLVKSSTESTGVLISP
jgi:hypothetical protein